MPYDFSHMWNIKNKQKTNEQSKTKQKQTCRYREQSSGYQMGKNGEEGKMCKGDQLCGEEWKLNFWW